MAFRFENTNKGIIKTEEDEKIIEKIKYVDSVKKKQFLI